MAVYDVDGRPVELGHAKQRRLLAVLAVDVDRVVPVDRLVEQVWGVDSPLRARATLHGYISRLRRALAQVEGVAIERRSGGYTLTTDPTRPLVDLHRFRELCARAREQADDAQAARLLTEALELWRGQALTGVHGEWAEVERERLERERLAAQHELTDIRLRLGEGADLVVELAARVAEHPLDERVAGQYVLALHRAGRTADALQHYRELRERLVDELGTDPGAALRNLHRRILAADPALSTPAAGADGPRVVPLQLPSAPALFTGRVTELAELDRALTTSDRSSGDGGGGTGATAVISAIGGTGGIGKTWLALTWANRNLHRFPDGQLFVDLRGFGPGDPKQASDVLADFLTALGVDRDRLPADSDARAALYRTHTSGKRLLVLLDNAVRADQVIPLLPGGDSCTVLITSRHRLPTLLTRHGARPLSLDVLTDAEARTLLIDALGDTRTTPDAHRAITDLTALCAGLPLALGLVAVRVRTHPHLVDDIATELRDLGLNALDSDDPHASLPVVLSWSLRHLTERQRTLFGLLGLAPGPDTTSPAVESLARLPSEEAHKALSALEEASLVERRPHGRYAMHDLVRDFAAATARATLTEDVREAALVRVIDFHLHTAHTANRRLDSKRYHAELDPPAPGVHPLPLPDAVAAMAWLVAEHAILMATQRAAAALGRHHVVWQLAWTLNTFHYRRGHRRDALASWRAALNAAEHLPDPTNLSRAHRSLGHALLRLGLREEATEHLTRALALAVSHHDTVEQAHTHHSLATAWDGQGDDRRGLEHARQALDLYRSIGRPEWEAEALNSVGWYAARLGEFDAARDHCHAALTLFRHHDDVDGEAQTLDSLGFIAHHAGDHRQAFDYYHHALALRRTHGHTYQVADTLDSLGHLHVILGQHQRARAVWGEAMESYRAQGRDTDADHVRRRLDALAHSGDAHPDGA